MSTLQCHVLYSSACYTIWPKPLSTWTWCKVSSSCDQQVKPVTQHTDDRQLLQSVMQLWRHSVNRYINKTSEGKVHCRSFLTSKAVYSAFTCAHNLPLPGHAGGHIIWERDSDRHPKRQWDCYEDVRKKHAGIQPIWRLKISGNSLRCHGDTVVKFEEWWNSRFSPESDNISILYWKNTMCAHLYLDRWGGQYACESVSRLNCK